jgi:hypothetical protein
MESINECNKSEVSTVNMACRITAFQHDTSAPSGTLFYLVLTQNSNTGSEYRIQSASWQRSDRLLIAALITPPVILNLNEDGGALTFVSAPLEHTDPNGNWPTTQNSGSSLPRRERQRPSRRTPSPSIAAATSSTTIYKSKKNQRWQALTQYSWNHWW